MKNERVLVTGGAGFLGRNLRKMYPLWDYPTRKDFDLLNLTECYNMIEYYRPDVIVHLAGKVGGIKENSTKQAEFLYVNSKINLNVVEAARLMKVPRLLAALSTCVFPDYAVQYPLTEENILDGWPAKTNFGYAMAKRNLYAQVLSYREQYKLDYVTFTLTNLYGPQDSFDLNSSHFVPAAIRKVYETQHDESIEFWGTGNALRQELFVTDFCKLLPQLIERHHSNLPLIIAPDENLSIKEMANIIVEHSGKTLYPYFSGILDGQIRKDGSNARLFEIIDNLEFTSFFDGSKQTYEWYKNQREAIK